MISATLNNNDKKMDHDFCRLFQGLCIILLVHDLWNKYLNS